MELVDILLEIISSNPANAPPQIKRISLELANLKSYQDDGDYGYDEES
jgi:hypothetical protein